MPPIAALEIVRFPVVGSVTQADNGSIAATSASVIIWFFFIIFPFNMSIV
jgi:hypothetical protein